MGIPKVNDDNIECMCGIILPAYALFHFLPEQDKGGKYIINILIALGLQGGNVHGRYGLFGFRTIEEELTMLAVLSAIQAILLICGYCRNMLDKRQENLGGLIFDIGMFIKNMYERWRKRGQQKGAGE